MRWPLSPPLSLLALVIATTISTSAYANFASDPTRKESPSFTRFFLKRFDKWFVANVGDPRKGLDKKEAAFIDEFLLTVPSFGQKSDGGFVRFIRYGVAFDGDKFSLGPHRFVLSDSQSSLKSKLLEISASKGIRLDKNSEAALKGIGFSGLSGELELIFEDSTGELTPESLRKATKKRPIWLTRLYRSGRLVSSEALELDVDSKGPCLGARSFSQIDQVFFENGDSALSCHISLLEDRALMPAARELVVKIRRGLNLFPGTLEVSGKRTRAFYP